MYINSLGNVGIGTTSPSKQLSISGLMYVVVWAPLQLKIILEVLVQKVGTGNLQWFWC